MCDCYDWETLSEEEFEERKEEEKKAAVIKTIEVRKK
jgi:hypothetical protein